MKPNPEQIKEILSLALQKPSAAERAAYLEESCRGDPELRQEVESLLFAHDQAGSFLTQKVTMPDPIPGTERAGMMVGRYKLLELIGEGGFGTVWMAEQQEPVRRRVALKVIKPGMDTKQVLARFEAERQALAMMDYPGIARVFDGGATDAGRPYFVMELVLGTRITDYCDANRLSTRERLGLFIQLCKAMQHAHQKGIIHRDLKPSNVLVTEVDGAAVPKVIDFGVAKATEARLTDRTLFTGLNQVVGTPAYMSPEQAGLGALDIDTRSDIYGLGVLLYEILTGHTPITKEAFQKAAWNEVTRLIQEQDPPKPSTRLSSMSPDELTSIAARRQTGPLKLGRLLRGDLDSIVMKCLEKNRNRRYESASSLANDLQSHLDNQPIVASPPGFLRRIEKLVRRNKTIVAVATPALLMALGLLAYWWRLPGTLRLDVVPADAQMEVDGTQMAVGAMPVELRLAAGVHQLKFQKSQYTNEERTVVVRRGGFSSPTQIALKHYQGALRVESSPPGIGIKVGGQEFYSKIDKLALDTGDYNVTAFGVDCFDETHHISILQDQVAPDRFSLENGVSWKQDSPSVQGEFLVITNNQSGGPPVIINSTLGKLLSLSSRDGSSLGPYGGESGRTRGLTRMDLVGAERRVIISTEGDPRSSPLVEAFADLWPPKTLWQWHGPTNDSIRATGVSRLAVTDGQNQSRLAVSGVGGHVRLLDFHNGHQVQDIDVGDQFLEFTHLLASWVKSGQSYLFALNDLMPTNAGGGMQQVEQGILVNMDTGKVVWRKNMGTCQSFFSFDFEGNGTPWIVLWDSTYWRTFREETGEQLAGRSIKDQTITSLGVAKVGGNSEYGLVITFANPMMPITAVRALDATILWGAPTNLANPKILVPDKLALHTPDGKLLVKLDDSLMALNSTNGQPEWRLSAPPDAMLVDDSTGDVYVTVQDQRLICLDSSGHTNWTLRLTEDVAPIALVPSGNKGGHPGILLFKQNAKLMLVHWPQSYLLWKVDAHGSILSPPLVTTASNGVRSVVHYLSDKGAILHLQGVNASNGCTLWKHELHRFHPNRPPVLAELDGDGVPELVAIGVITHDGVNRLVVLRAADGRLVRDPEISAKEWTGCTPLVADFRGQGESDVVVNTWDKPRIIMLDGRTGKTLWQHETEAPNMGGLAALDVDGDGLPDVISTSGDGHVYALRGKDGNRLWRTPGTNLPSFSLPIVADLDWNGTQQLLLTTLEGGFAVLNGRTGDVIWSPKLEDALTNSNIRMAGHAITTTLGGRQHIIAPMGAGGVVAFDWGDRREIWSSPKSAAVIASPVLADLAHDGNPVVVAGTIKGDVILLRLSDGKVLWREKIADGVIEADPVVSDLNGDGIDDVLISSHDSTLYALDGRKLLFAIKTR